MASNSSYTLAEAQSYESICNKDRSLRAFLHFAITNFDPGRKAQGAPGIDVEAQTADGKTIIGELKTTKPYQPGFGAAQRTSILKDIKRLAGSKADHRFMFVVDPDAYKALSHSSFATQAPGIEVVDLVLQKSFVY
jgi:hypothetical protein